MDDWDGCLGELDAWCRGLPSIRCLWNWQCYALLGGFRKSPDGQAVDVAGSQEKRG